MPEPGERDVEERHRGQHGAPDTVVGHQMPNGPFENERRAGYGVEDLAVFGGGEHKTLGDLAVHVGERIGRLVDLVERRRLAEERGGWVAGGANEAVGMPGDCVKRLVGDVLGAARPETDDDDVAGRWWAHEVVRATTDPVPGSHLP